VLLGIEQFTESEKGGDRQSGALRHLDSAAEIFVEHPLGDKKLPRQEKPLVPGCGRMMNTFFPESLSGRIADDEGNGSWRSKHAYCVGTSQRPDATRVAGCAHGTS
jgi:hypothetical protein